MFLSLNTFILESFIELNMSMWICIKSLLKHTGNFGNPSFGDYLSLFLAAIFGITIHALPLYVMLKYRLNLRQKPNDAVNSLIQDINVKYLQFKS